MAQLFAEAGVEVSLWDVKVCDLHSIISLHGDLELY